MSTYLAMKSMDVWFMTMKLITFTHLVSMTNAVNGQSLHTHLANLMQ